MKHEAMLLEEQFKDKYTSRCQTRFFNFSLRFCSCPCSLRLFPLPHLQISVLNSARVLVTQPLAMLTFVAVHTATGSGSGGGDW